MIGCAGQVHEINVLKVIESEGLNPTGPEEVKRCIVCLCTLD